MEQEVIPLTTQFDAIAPDTGKLVKVVGIDMSDPHIRPKLICLVTDINGTRVEIYDRVKNKRLGA
ncbi:hypothetical protein [Mesorhizobium helmanticense]|uniref:Uncharacterized protein n=1 Tax=Mesorhizobium helmanticense TaxID=1776423 RepID=A0A2T4IRM6_9HYPH|nr:hypothetical protein [Mesorhizobium helmanticense]PTE08218.1 hypothetical protein C9427_21460 [Mesorhizobium helmanticense]